MLYLYIMHAWFNGVLEAFLDFTASEWLENSATAFLLFQIGSGAAQSSTEIDLPWQEKISGDAE